jgi:hypothetical protein
MSKFDKVREIYNSNIFYPSTNHLCGINIEENKAYKCPSNKYCNFNGICENVNCIEYVNEYVNKHEPNYMDISKFDGSDVSRNNVNSFCKYSISTDGKCGLENNNTKCPDGQCCSINGTCGYDKESCIPIAFFYPESVKYGINRHIYSNSYDVLKFQKNFLVNNIAKKYIENNNFEPSTNGKCGIDLLNEKIIKCNNNEYCNYENKCSTDYDKYSDKRNIFKNYGFDNGELKDLSYNLIHGQNFNEEYKKWQINKTQESKDFLINNIDKKYDKDNLESSMFGSCGVDLINEKIIKCNNNEYCNNKNNCSTDYDKYNNDNILKNVRLPYHLIHGENFNEEYTKWRNKGNKVENEVVNEVANEVANEVDNNNIFKMKSLDCTNKQLLDNLKTYYNTLWKNEYKIVNIVQINKVDNNTCDVKYNFEGNSMGQNSRRFTIQYKPDVGYFCTNMGEHLSGLTTLPLDSTNSLIPGIIVGVIIVVLITYLLSSYLKKIYN